MTLQGIESEEFNVPAVGIRLDWEYCWVLTLKYIRNMGIQAEACGYGLRETDITKCIPPSIKPSYKTESQLRPLIRVTANVVV